MASEIGQASPKLQKEELQLQNERHGMGNALRTKTELFILNLKQFKSIEILKSALTICTSNTKFMLFMILSITPFFAFMVFNEIKLHNALMFLNDTKLQKSIDVLPYLLTNSSSFKVLSVFGDDAYNFDYDDWGQKVREFFHVLVQLCLFYLVLYPVLEIINMIITMKIAAKAHAGERQATLKQVLYQKNSLKSLSITCLLIHLLWIFNLIGFLTVMATHLLFTRGLGFDSSFIFNPIAISLFLAFLALHSAIFLTLVHKYLEWGAYWNMIMVISILGESTGMKAMEMADYYGKHYEETGFQLMLVFFALGNILRLSCLSTGLYSATVGGVLIATIVTGLVCFGNLVKWVAFVLHFYDCKQQTLDKKADEEIRKAKNNAVHV